MMKTITVTVPEALATFLLTTYAGHEQPPAQSTAEGGWPRILEFAQPFGPNVRVMAEESINWQWQPAMSDILFGAMSPGSFVFEPSNGKAVGKPLRSPAGYPLRYAVVGSEVIGTPTVLYGGESFNSDAEVQDFIARKAAIAAMPKNPAQPTWADVNARIGEGAADIPAAAEFKPDNPAAAEQDLTPK